tara:strand:+ start:1021 stop:2058 length:1038 start_codon:yes stop_codon:yes gene_type:complete
MIHYYGIVEDRHDPLKIGRVRVRIYGIHTENKSLIATPDLPWSQVLLPTTSAGLSGFGTQHGLVEGSTIVGFFRNDTDMQDFIIIGSVAGIPSEGYRKDVDDKIKKRTPDEGFSDPRRLTKADYDKTVDGKNPPEVKRPFGLEHGLDTAPIKPKKLKLNYSGKGSSYENPKLTEKDLPLYPLRTDDSDVSQYARGIIDYTYGGDYNEGKVGGRDTYFNSAIMNPPSRFVNIPSPMYPYNKVYESESGHLIEVDDTRDAERIAVEHRTGTFFEIHPDGSQVTRIVNDNWYAVYKDNEMYVGGNCKVFVEGDAKIEVKGKTDIESTGNLSVVAPQISLDGTVIKLNS